MLEVYVSLLFICITTYIGLLIQPADLIYGQIRWLSSKRRWEKQFSNVISDNNEYVVLEDVPTIIIDFISLDLMMYHV